LLQIWSQMLKVLVGIKIILILHYYFRSRYNTRQYFSLYLDFIQTIYETKDAAVRDVDTAGVLNVTPKQRFSVS
jgi:hypothetical protein